MSDDAVHPHSYFEHMYAGSADPWGFDTEWYERRKYDITMAVLPRRHYRRALEPGCANGALTERLADRCDLVEAFDFVGDAVSRARKRLANRPSVSVQLQQFPDYWPDGTGDLVVWSEVAYYLTEAARPIAEQGLDRWLEPDGHLVGVHYSGDTNYPMTGPEVAVWLDQLPYLERLTTLTDPLFQACVWRRI